MSVESPGFANQNSTYGAEQTRRAFGSLIERGASIGSIMGGTAAPTDCMLTAPASGMSVNVAAGEIWVPGSSSSSQSGYYCRVSSQTNLAIAAADPSNPRIDRVSALITDSAYAGGTNTFAAAVETGTPTAGATLVNLSGAAAAPTSSYTLGYVLVPAAATNIVSADISNVASVLQLSPYMSGYGYRAAASSLTANPGDWVLAAPGVTITLPTAARGASVKIQANGSVTAASPVTVSGSNIQGIGLSSASSFPLGMAYSAVELYSDGTNWEIVSGTQDSGWLSFTYGTNSSATANDIVPGYRLLGDRVWLKGNVSNSGGVASWTIGTGMVYFPTTTNAVIVTTVGGSSSVPVEVFAYPNSGGTAKALNASSIGGSAFGSVLLDGLSYTLS